MAPIVRAVAVGHQWYWEYQTLFNQRGILSLFSLDRYTEVESCSGTNRLVNSDYHILVPREVPFRFVVRRADVIHNFNLKGLAVSLDAVPGRVHRKVLNIFSPGLHFGLCSEVCGVGHYIMSIVVEAVPLPLYSGFFRIS